MHNRTSNRTTRRASRREELFAAVVAAARNLGAHFLYSEDLSHGQSYADVQVLNPFRPT